MATLDIFSGDAFSAVSMTRAISRVPYSPAFLGGLNIFEVDRLTTTFAGIERRDGKLSLIGTTERGGPPELGQEEGRDVVPVKIPRLAKRQRQQSQAIQNIRAFGSQTELMGVQDAVIRIQQRQMADLELTKEYHRLGAVQGKLLDKDGRVLVDWFKTFGINQPAEIDFELDDPNTDVRGKCNLVTRGMVTAAKGTILPSTRIYGLAGNTFFDNLVGHVKVADTYRFQEGARMREGTAFSAIDFGGITFVNYRGTDDGSAIAIGDTKCKFFPVGAPGVFGVAYAPFEAADFVNTPGLDQYAIVVWDQERRFWWQPEIYSYPLHYCTIPELLLRAKNF